MAFPGWYKPFSPSYSLDGFESIISYQFHAETLLQEALNAGPHKELAQLGSAALLFCFILDGRKRRKSRARIYVPKTSKPMKTNSCG